MSRRAKDIQRGPFRRYAVLNVLSSTIIDQEKCQELHSKIGNNSRFAQTILEGEEIKYHPVMPRNSIVAKLIGGNEGSDTDDDLIIMYPIFSSHLSLPVKPGEIVWGAEFEEDLFYWLTRVHATDAVEDANFTHFDRIGTPVVQKALEYPEAAEVEIDYVPKFPNGINFGNIESDQLDPEETEDITVDPAAFSLMTLKSYDDIDEKNFSKGSYVVEPVPRITKRPGDLSLQGSNNTSIVLGTERGYKKGAGRNIDPEKSNSIPENDQASSSGLAPGMGAIDIVAGRGRLHKGLEDPDIQESANPIDTRARTTENSRGEKETAKNPGLDNTKAPQGSAYADGPEGDPDFEHDAARIYLSMSTDPDTLFDLSYPDQPSAGTTVEPSADAAAIVLKSDNLRLVARKDPDNEIEGSIRIVKEGTAEADRATIVIQPDGTIMIDGPKIIIGDGREDPAGPNGEGTQVILGRDATESILLGDKLITMIKALETKFNAHIHGSAAGNTTPHAAGGATADSAEAWDTAKSKIGKTK